MFTASIQIFPRVTALYFLYFQSQSMLQKSELKKSLSSRVLLQRISKSANQTEITYRRTLGTQILCPTGCLSCRERRVDGQQERVRVSQPSIAAGTRIAALIPTKAGLVKSIHADAQVKPSDKQKQQQPTTTTATTTTSWRCSPVTREPRWHRLSFETL